VHDATRRALNRLNQRFYAGDSAADFSRTRSAPWPGWDRALACALPGEPAPHVLDVGCGNGRFAQALARRHPAAHYTGFDLSPRLLKEARDACPLPHPRLIQGDLVESGPDALPDGPFDLLVAWGLLHHVPGHAARMELVRGWTSRLSPGGVLAFSFWQPPPFRANRLAAPTVVSLRSAALEPGDHLVRWGTSGEAVRYVHLADAAERTLLIDHAGLEPLDRYPGDPRHGDQNDYVVLRRGAGWGNPRSATPQVHLW
jgi:trans-aconitate methyltransferase